MINKAKITTNMVYNTLSPDVAKGQMDALQRLLDDFLKKSPLNREDIVYNDALLMKIIVRVDQRSDYFTYFHSTIDDNGHLIVDEMSQYKRIALLCFWLIKYKPFRIKDEKLDFSYYCQNHCTLNETFATYLFVSQINSAKMLNSKQKQYYKSPSYVNDLFYKFMHHDISKEAMIFSLCSIVCCK